MTTERYLVSADQVRALTVKQPWANLIIFGTPVQSHSRARPSQYFKDVENRAWPTNYRGPLVIHAASHAASEDQAAGMTRSAALGVVMLTDCHRATYSDEADPGAPCCGTLWAQYWDRFTHADYDDRPYHWLLSNPIPFDKPIRTRGHQQLWTPPKRAQLAGWVLQGGLGGIEQLRSGEQPLPL